VPKKVDEVRLLEDREKGQELESRKLVDELVDVR
jgi:hypothetical protein